MRVKPTNEARAATHPASTEDYDKLGKAVMQAIILKQKDVLFRLPYFVELCPTFPKGLLYKRDECYNYYRAKAFRLADWLYEKGVLPDDAKGIVKSMRTVVNLMGEVDRMLANPEKLLYNVNLEVEEE